MTLPHPDKITDAELPESLAKALGEQWMNRNESYDCGLPKFDKEECVTELTTIIQTIESRKP